MAEADPDGARLREMAAALGWAVMTVAPNAPYREEDMRFRAGNGNFRTAADVRRAYAERASEPTVDEMARDVRPTFADKLRALGLPTEMEHNGMYCHDHRGPALWIAMGEWVYSLGPHVGPGPRRWPTAEAAVDELYAEWVAKQGRLVIDPASPMLNEPPTDPSALAAWLYGRVVPGHTVVEWTEPGVDRIRTRKAFISALEQDVDHIVLWPHGDSALYVPPPANHTHRATKLVNPDGTVLWESS
jgi:hypothetical protein